jgi:uncharacterized membrane protein
MASRPLDPGAVISRALEIYREQAGVLIPAALAVFSIQAIATVVLSGALGVVVSLASLVLGTFYQGMVVELVRDVQDGRRDSSVGQLFASIAPVLITLIAVAILYGLAVAIGIALFLVPGLFLMTIWAVTGPVVVLERPRVVGAFRRSHELVRGNGWPVFVVVLVVVVGLAVVSAIAALVAAGLGDVGEALVQWVVNAVTAPLSALTAAVLYLTLRQRAGEPPVGAGPQPQPQAADPFGS